MWAEISKVAYKAAGTYTERIIRPKEARPGWMERVKILGHNGLIKTQIKRLFPLWLRI